MTTPIARLVAQRLAGSSAAAQALLRPPAYRRASVGRGQSAELYQAGVEVVGSASPREDAATIAFLVDVLQSLGLQALPTSRSCSASRPSTRATCGTRPRSGSDRDGRPRREGPRRRRRDSAKAAVRGCRGVRGIPRLVGPRRTGPSSGGRRSRWGRRPGRPREPEGDTASPGGARRARGGHPGPRPPGATITTRARSTRPTPPASGFTIANGGRYDNLLRRFGKELPATGFAIYLERLLSVLPEEEPATPARPRRRRRGWHRSGRGATGDRRARLASIGGPSARGGCRVRRSVEAAWISYPAQRWRQARHGRPTRRVRVYGLRSVARTVLS